MAPDPRHTTPKMQRPLLLVFCCTLLANCQGRNIVQFSTLPSDTSEPKTAAVPFPSLATDTEVNDSSNLLSVATKTTTPTTVPSISRSAVNAIPAHESSHKSPTTKPARLSPTTKLISANQTVAAGTDQDVSELLTSMNSLLNAVLKTGGSEDQVGSRLVDTPRKQALKMVESLAEARTGDVDPNVILATLLLDPSFRGMLSRVEDLMLDKKSSPTLQDTLNSPDAMSLQDMEENLQAGPDNILPDVIKGLQLLSLLANGQPQEVEPASVGNPGLVNLMSLMPEETVPMMLEVLSTRIGKKLWPQPPLDSSSQCSIDIGTVGRGMQQQQQWALEMLDASGKLRPGVMTGQMTLFGDYDQCMAVSYSNQTLPDHLLQAQLCRVTVTVPDVLTTAMTSQEPLPAFSVHVCIPRSCQESDMVSLLDPIAQAAGSNITDVQCLLPKSPRGDPWFAGVMTILVLLSLLCAAGTAYDVYLDMEKKENQPCLQDQNGKEKKGCDHGGLENDKSAGVRIRDYTNGAWINGNTGSNDEGKIAVKTGHMTGHMTDIDMDNVEYGPLNGERSHMEGQAEDGAACVAMFGDGQRLLAEDSVASQLLLSFSVLRNGRKLLDCTKKQADISCLHGIRVLSITWIIFGHVYSLAYETQGNKTGLPTLLSNISFMVLPGALRAVDTFFFLSGTLTAVVFLRKSKKSSLTTNNMLFFLVHRYWRMTPLYALVLMFYIGVFPYLKKGPFQDLVGSDSVTWCRKNWHSNLFYFNNFAPKVEETCFGWSWYLSVEMQLSIMTPLLLVPLASRGRLRIMGFVLAAGLILISIITSGVITYRENLSIFMPGQKALRYLEVVYCKPWCRMGPYVIGLLYGSIMDSTNGRYTMTRMWVVIGWALAWAVGLTLVYVNYGNLKDAIHGLIWTAGQNGLYEALAKVLWAVCVGWVVFACCTGYGGFVNTLLSWSAWLPLSRLTYGVYLTHITILYVIAGNYKRPLYIDYWTGTNLYLSVTVLSFLAAFVFSMLIEVPTAQLEKVLLGQSFRKKKSK